LLAWQDQVLGPRNPKNDQVAVDGKEPFQNMIYARAGSASASVLPNDTCTPETSVAGGPPSGCFRFVISSEHSRAQLDNLNSVLRRFI
jgi:hypothetical protein